MDARDRFEAMYRAHGGAVRSFVHRRIAGAAADDVVSDVFLAAWRRLDEAPDDELPWLLGIARGLIANARRGSARRRALQDRLVATAEPQIAPGVEPPLGDSPLMRALAALSERDQEVLRLVAWDGLDRTRAARVLGITTSLFSLRLHRARRRLARALESGQARAHDGDERASMEALR